MRAAVDRLARVLASGSSGRALVWAVVVLAACRGQDVDLTGMYRVESAVASAPCGDDLPIAAPPAYLKFERGELFGNPFFTYLECADEAAADCRPAGGLLEGFFEPGDDGWSGYASHATGTDADCTLRVEERSATLDGAALVIEETIHSEERVMLPPDGCMPLEAETRGDAMPCVEHGRITATRL